MRGLLAPAKLASALLVTSACFSIACFSTAARASTASWFVRVEARAPLEMAKGDTLPALSLVPQRVFLLEADATPVGWKVAVPQGTLFVPVDGDASGKFCGMARHLGSAFHCLADRDRDGSPETYYYQQVFNEFYFGSTYSDGPATPLPEPARLRELDPFVQIAPVALGLRYVSGKPGGKLRFRLCIEEPSGAAQWRKGLYKTCLLQEFPVDPATGRLPLLGLSAQVARVDDKRVAVSFPADLRVVPVTMGGTTFRTTP